MIESTLTLLFYGVVAMHAIGTLACLVRMAGDSDDRASHLQPFGLGTFGFDQAKDYLANHDAREREAVLSKLMGHLAQGKAQGEPAAASEAQQAQSAAA